MKTKQNLLALALGCACATAQSAELGMQAPPLGIKEWIKGKPVTLETGNAAYLFYKRFLG